MVVLKFACITIAIGLSFAAETSDFEIRPRIPRDCIDVYRNGDQVEGYYAVVPNDNKPTEAALVYCDANDGMLPLNSSVPKSNPRNCQDLKDDGMANSGMNIIYPYEAHPDSPVVVYCDQEYMGGGWTVIQRRDEFDTELSFFRTFDEYSLGFGNPMEEFWLGLDIIYELTQQSVNEINIDMTNDDDVSKYAHYKTFYVGPKEPAVARISNRPYYLAATIYSGTAGDSLSNHVGMGFTTKDAENDDECAHKSMGGWWYTDWPCYTANLNGQYKLDIPQTPPTQKPVTRPTHTTSDRSPTGPTQRRLRANMVWQTFSDNLKRVEMKVRPLKQQ